MRKVSGASYQIEVSGEIFAASAEEFELRLQLSMNVDDAAISMNTTITTVKDHPIAFSISDVGDFRSAVVVEIVGGD